MKEQNIHKQLANGKRITLECKKAQTCVPNSLWNTYSAFANTYGGTILQDVIETHDRERTILARKILS